MPAGSGLVAGGLARCGRGGGTGTPATVSSFRPCGEARRQHDGLDQARGVGAILPGDVEGGAVIDRGADDRQAERDVDGGSEGEQLHRNESLVMVAGHDRVELAARGADEDGVAGNRARSRRCRSPRQRRDDRRDHAIVFVAHQPVLAAVRVQAGDGEPRPRRCRSRAARRAVGADRRRQHVRRQRRAHVGAARCARSRAPPSAARRGRTSPRRGDAGQVAEQVGVPLPRQAGQRERLLVDRRRGDGVDADGAARRRRPRRSRRRRPARPRRTAAPARSARAPRPRTARRGAACTPR